MRFNELLINLDLQLPLKTNYKLSLKQKLPFLHFNHGYVKDPAP